QPGSQRAEYPCMRLKRMSVSCKVASMACPMWSCPVMLGGGMTMVKGTFSGSTSARKYPFSSDSLYILSSNAPGLYVFCISILKKPPFSEKNRYGFIIKLFSRDVNCSADVIQYIITKIFTE